VIMIQFHHLPSRNLSGLKMKALSASSATIGTATLAILLLVKRKVLRQVSGKTVCCYERGVAMDKTLNEAVLFFKSEQTYQKLFMQFKKKYESLGRIGGTIPVQLFTDEELEVIGGFFGMPGSRLNEKGSISVAAFERHLADTRFGDIELKSLLDGYFGEVIISKKQRRQEKKDALRRYVEVLRAEHPHLRFWCDYLLENRGVVRWRWILLDKTPDDFAAMTARLDSAYRSLPDSPERLPMFSQRITGDPHAFDLHAEQGKLWLHLLAVGADVTFPLTTEDTNELLQNYQIYR